MKSPSSMSVWGRTRLGDMSSAIICISLEFYGIDLHGALNAWEDLTPKRRKVGFLINFSRRNSLQNVKRQLNVVYLFLCYECGMHLFQFKINIQTFYFQHI